MIKASRNKHPQSVEGITMWNQPTNKYGETIENSKRYHTKIIQYLFQSGLSEHPTIARLLNTAINTGNFRELNCYLDKTPKLLQAVNLMNSYEEQIRKQMPYYPLPDGEELKKLSGPIKLGIINKRSGILIFFCIHPDILTMHSMIAGRTGSGKSWFNANVLEQLVVQSSNFGYNVIVPDVKLFYRRLIGKLPGLKVITFDKLILNLLEVPEWMDPRDFVNLLPRKFAADNILGTTSIRLLFTALEKLFKEKGIFEGSKNYPKISELLRKLVQLQVDKTYGPHFRDIFDTIIQRLGPYVFLEKNFGVRKGISHEVFTSENVVIELPLNKVPEEVHNFVVSWIANLTYAKNITFGLRGNKLRTFFLIDEARTILSATRERSWLEWIEPGLNEIITKGREFGLGLWLCSQETGSFSKVFRSNCLLKISFPLTDGEDVSEIKKSFALSDEQTEYLFKLPERRVAICRYGMFERPFLLVVPELTGFDQIPNDKKVEEEMSDFYKRILPKKEEEDIIIQEPIVPEFGYSQAEIDGVIMLKHLAKHPFLNYGDLIKELKLTPARGDTARAWMANSGFTKIHSITLRPGKPGEYFELTEHAYNIFGGKAPIGKGSFEHKCFCHSGIKNFVEAQEFGVRLEGMMEGSQKAFDVLAWKKGEGMIGYEVTLHFQNLIKNLKEDLGTTVKQVVVVCKNKDELEKAKWIVKNEMGELNRVDFKTIFEFTRKN